jgi:segregation and condensation protein B
VTHPRFGRWIRILRDEPPPVKLTQSAIETLAIVAYRQPVTRTEIETVRGVSAEAGINKLLERELIYIVGRADLPGRPLQYGTTDRFLEFVGVKSLVELPSSDVLSPRQIDEWLKTAINPKPVTDAEMGLPLEEGEGASPNFESVSVEHESTTPNAPAAFEPATEPEGSAGATPSSA